MSPFCPGGPAIPLRPGNPFRPSLPLGPDDLSLPSRPSLPLSISKVFSLGDVVVVVLLFSTLCLVVMLYYP